MAKLIATWFKKRWILRSKIEKNLSKNVSEIDVDLRVNETEFDNDYGYGKCALCYDRIQCELEMNEMCTYYDCHGCADCVYAENCELCDGHHDAMSNSSNQDQDEFGIACSNSEGICEGCSY